MSTIDLPAVPVLPLLSMVRSPSLAEQAATAIVAGVSGGALKPGQRLVEAELASLLNMSRVPLREALKILEAQGIVESIPHRGTRITMFDEMRVNQICEVRIALERIAVGYAVQKYKSHPELLQRLDSIIDKMERAAENLDWTAVDKFDLEFHREFCRASGNEIVLTLWEGLARHVFIVFGHERREDRDAKVTGPHHRHLRDLLAQGDVGALHAEIELHVMRLRDRRKSHLFKFEKRAKK